MGKKIIFVLVIIFTQNIVSALPPEAYLQAQKELYEERLRTSAKKLADAQKTRDQKITDAINAYFEALKKIKLHYTKKGNLEKALIFKKKLEEFEKVVKQNNGSETDQTAKTDPPKPETPVNTDIEQDPSSEILGDIGGVPLPPK